MKPRDSFTTIRTEGGLLPGDLLHRIAVGDGDLDGLDPKSYHLGAGERLNEAISRSWNRLVGVWGGFRGAAEKFPEQDPGTTLTRERWLLILFQELGYGRLPASRAVDLDGKTYPISHFWENAPLHLLGLRVPLDHRTPGVAGAARTSPHSLLQEFLNQSDRHLWGFVSNGLQLRILRDNRSLTRAAFVEFDLEGMMEGEVFSDFAVLWLLCHQSRVEAERPEECWLERWAQAAREQGTRALDRLRESVEQAIRALGSGLAHPANNDLRTRLRSGELSTQDYYRQVLRLVYRLLFLFVAEDRDLLLNPAADADARGRYTRFYSTARLRTLAQRRRTKHCDLYRGLSVVMSKLGSDDGCPELALPALGSFLWSHEAVPDLAEADISNRDFLEAIRALAFAEERKVLLPVDYKNLGSEELGSVYESLLELHPELNTDAATFDLKVAAGHERKTTGSYYTPSSLVQCLLDSALDPVLEEAAGKSNPERTILELKVCDPACGSGHFLIAAAHRIAKRLAAVRTGEDEPSPDALQHAVRDVIGHCIYGVDINPMAVELCKVNLWLEALEPGKPLSFLDHKIQCGNSLLGATPALLAKGIPDEAFMPIEGDDKELCRDYRKQNREERKGQMMMRYGPDRAWPWERLGDLATGIATLNAISDEAIEGIHQKEARYAEIVASTGYLFNRLRADAWCAAFIWRKVNDPSLPYAITEEVLRKIEANPHSVGQWMRDEVQHLAGQYAFFHWHLAFPDVFRVPAPDEESENEQTGWSGGFHVVLGNPPWERIKLQEKEFFASRNPDIASAPKAATRRDMIAALKDEDPELYRAFHEARRKAEGESKLVRNTGRYPLCGRGDVNTYAVFAELKRSLLSSVGRVGCIVPSGIATDDTTKFFFQDLMEKQSLASLYDFENRKGIFPDVQGNIKFCLFTVSALPQDEFLVASQLDQVSAVHDPARRYMLSAEDVRCVNPNTLNCPTLRTAKDAALVKAIYRRVPVLIKEGPSVANPWDINFLRMFDMTNDSQLFRTKEELEAESCVIEGNLFRNRDMIYTPLYEAKLIGQFNHRAATFDDVAAAQRFRIHAGTNQPDIRDLAMPTFSVLPRYWLDLSEVHARVSSDRPWFLGFRNAMSAVADARSLIAAIVPYVAVGNSMPLLFVERAPWHICSLLAAMNSFCLDYVLRQKASGGNLNFYIFKQLPFPSPDTIARDCCWLDPKSFAVWTSLRVIELTYTAGDLQPFAKDCGYFGPAFRWEEERRLLIRCELDAAFFHLYLGTLEEWRRKGTPELIEAFPTSRHAVDYIMETFPIVKRKDEKQYGEYRTKRVILEIYDAMAESIRTGNPYQTLLDPPPGPPCDEQGTFIPMAQWDAAIWQRYKNVIHPARKETHS